jgi:hypothetical protein
MSKKSRPVKASTTTKTYVYCHIAAHNALKHAKGLPTGSLYFYMMAATFSAFTVEAFLNHLGERRVPRWAALERRLGPKEKLILLQQALHLSVDESRRPFQTLSDMLRVRNALAHGRTLETLSDVPVASADRWPEPDWKMLCRPASVGRMVEDADRMVQHLNAQAGIKRDPFGSLGGGWSA